MTAVTAASKTPSVNVLCSTTPPPVSPSISCAPKCALIGRIVRISAYLDRRPRTTRRIGMGSRSMNLRSNRSANDRSVAGDSPFDGKKRSRRALLAELARESSRDTCPVALFSRAGSPFQGTSNIRVVPKMVETSPAHRGGPICFSAI